MSKVAPFWTTSTPPTCIVISTEPGLPDLPAVHVLLVSHCIVHPVVMTTVSPATGTPLGDQLLAVCQFLAPEPLQL